MNLLKLLLILLILFINHCSKEEKEISIISENNQELELIKTYEDAYKALYEGDPFYASKKFLEVELLLPQSEWAPKSVLMASYSYYLINYYSEAIFNLERYLKTYPKDENLVYAHYLIAMCYYETIEDEKRDSGPLFKARDKFFFIINNYPKTDFAMDAKFKLDLIEDILASKEMYLGRHYLKKKKWIAAINRFKNVVLEYDESIFIEEALHRLVEIHYSIGLNQEAEKYAQILGYNYKSSQWYKKSYKIFNENYSDQVKVKIEKDKEGMLKKFKSLFD
jgi:outer membrane protein assembly factor BamD